ncbi:MAG: DoxX family protein [Mycobacterium sp.]
MSTTAEVDVEHAQTRWNPLTRIAFRFTFVYFGLFCLVFAQILFVFTGVLGGLLPDTAVLSQLVFLTPLLGWVGRTVFGTDVTLHVDSGSGDQAVIWVLVFTLLVVAVAATVIWTALDRRRPAYPRLHAWFLTFLRLCVGGQMLFYGMAKLIPTQMPAPALSALLQPFGEMSPATVLWLQVGSSHPYEMVLGAAEVAGGLLLFLPRTATLGALISLVSMIQVFVLNMTFDVPVKILSLHLLLLALVLLAPQFGKLADVFLRGRSAQPLSQPALFTTARANRYATVAQVLMGVWVLVGASLISWSAWTNYGGGAPKPDLYGMWVVTEFNRDGAPVAPLLTDDSRWQRIVFDTPGAATVQHLDGRLEPVGAEVDTDAGTVTLSGDPDPVGTFVFAQPAPDRLTLDGTIAGAPVTLSLQLEDPSRFTLLNRGFNWVQEYPYFR